MRLVACPGDQPVTLYPSYPAQAVAPNLVPLALGASGTPVSNTNAYPVVVQVAGGVVSAISVSGTSTGQTAGTFTVPAAGTITVTYTSKPPVFTTASAVPPVISAIPDEANEFGIGYTCQQFLTQPGVASSLTDA